MTGGGRHAGRLVVLGLASLLTVSGVHAHPPSTPEHGFNESTYWMLWSGDAEQTPATPAPNASGPRQLAAGTDVPLDASRQVVERWNHADREELPATDAETVLYPRNVSRRNGTYVKDAYVDVGAIHPSTKAHLTPSRQPHYVGPNGTVHGVVDYRVRVPEDDDSGTRRTEWDLEDHEVERVELAANGTTVDSVDQSKRPDLSYRDVDELRGDTVELELTAKISVELTKETSVRTRTCPDRSLGDDSDGDAEGSAESSRSGLPVTPVGDSDGRDESSADDTSDTQSTTATRTSSCTVEWETAESTETESVTVQTTKLVEPYDLDVSGFRATYPNGDQGLVVYVSKPWLGFRAGDDHVRGIWRFYAARDTQWDELVERDGNTTSVRHSPFHPVQVHAYPIAAGPAPESHEDVSLLEVYGTSQRSPELPESVALETVDGNYTASFGIAIRRSDGDHDDPVVAQGLVRGSQQVPPADEMRNITISESNLTMTVLNRTDRTVTVQTRLEDTETGEPIETTDREGYVDIGDQTVNTTANGTATVTLDRRTGAVTARYEPGDWWRNYPAYVGDTAVVSAGGTVIYYVRTLFRGFVPVGLLLLAIYLVDRITGWHVWPPWRGLE
ncbi:hypothetical protein [Halomicrobium salinisoli]|uniref:hypothetical protein n=1 Tax=Halomicrobium salinisoli TaxID=2878391 RepID=UPI001CEFD6E0|nr:hypothetical protein [Halomicrobium salinisoli]